MKITNSQFTGFKNGFFSQYNVKNQPINTSSIFPTNNSGDKFFLNKFQNNIAQNNIKYVDLNNLQSQNNPINNVLIKENGIPINIVNIINKNKNVVRNYQFTPIKVLGKISSQSSKKINDLSPIYPIKKNQNIKYISTPQRSFSSRQRKAIDKNQMIDSPGIASSISVYNFNKDNMIGAKYPRGGSSESHVNLIRGGSSQTKRQGIRGCSSEMGRESIEEENYEVIKEHKISGLGNIHEKQNKPYKLKELPGILNENIISQESNLRRKELDKKLNKMSRVNENGKKIKKPPKIILKPIKEAPLEVIEKIKKEKALVSNRSKAAMYGKKIKKPIELKSYFSEKILNNNNMITNIYEDCRLDFSDLKEEKENKDSDDDVIEFFKDEDIKINNYDFEEEIMEHEKKGELFQL